MLLRYGFSLCLLFLAAGSADARELIYVRQQDTVDAVRQAISRVFGSTFNKSYAVVIGVGNYRKDVKLPPLSAPAADAVRMHNFLKDEAGFDYIITLTDEHASKGRIEDLMDRALPSMVGVNDRFLFYFSGHGLTRTLADGQKRGYLALADATSNSWNLMIDMPRVRQWTENFYGARHSLFLLDACFSGLAAFEPKSPVQEKTLERLRQPAHHLMTAGTEGEQSFIVNGESLFTQTLLSAARGNSAFSTGDPYVSLSEVLVQINRALDRKRAEVNDKIRMTPRIYYSRISNNSGEFFFVTTATSTRQIQEPGNRTSPNSQVTPKSDAPPPSSAPPAPPAPPASPAPGPLVSSAPSVLLSPPRPLASPSPAPPVPSGTDDRSAFEHAHSAYTIDAFKEYLSAYPAGQFAKRALEAIEALSRRENEAKRLPPLRLPPYFVRFAPGDAFLSVNAMTEVTRAAEQARSIGKYVFVIGFDNGQQETKQKVSIQRVNAVKAALIRERVPASKILVVGGQTTVEWFDARMGGLPVPPPEYPAPGDSRVDIRIIP